jgi:surface carbohydrate biosynthesis protein
LFKRLINLWQSFCRVIFSEKKWCWPRQSDVLILDASQPEVFEKYFKPWSPEVLYMRGEQFNMLVLLASFFRRGSRVNAYTDCFIEKVRPRLIATYMHHYPNFYTLSGKYPNIKTLFVQHGLVSQYESIFEVINSQDSETTSNYSVDYMLVLGSGVGKKLSQHVDGEIIVVGGAKNNLVPKEKSPQQGVIAFISQWRPVAGMNMSGNFCPFDDFWRKPDSLILSCLVRYAKAKNKRLMIIPNRHKNGSEERIRGEEGYFRELLGSELRILSPSGPDSGYQAVDSAELVVSVDSNLGLESIARGNKTAVFSIRGQFANDTSLNFGWPGDFPDEGPFWTNNPDPDSFVRILDYLFDVDDIQWRKDVKASKFSSVMRYDPGNSILKKTLERILGVPPSP